MPESVLDDLRRREGRAKGEKKKKGLRQVVFKINRRITQNIERNYSG